MSKWDACLVHLHAEERHYKYKHPSNSAEHRWCHLPNPLFMKQLIINMNESLSYFVCNLSHHLPRLLKLLWSLLKFSGTTTKISSSGWYIRMRSYSVIQRYRLGHCWGMLSHKVNMYFLPFKSHHFKMSIYRLSKINLISSLEKNCDYSQSSLSVRPVYWSKRLPIGIYTGISCIWRNGLMKTEKM